MSEEAYPDALPVGHRLHWYTLEHVLGQGGFGITYLARDTNLDRPVAIKEYLPADYARRDDSATVRPRSESLTERYAWGLERFANEARTLARFDHPNIVRVHSVFEANNTAYMVMRFEEGENLSRLLDRLGTAPERQLTDCLLAILDGLQLVHDAGFIHRDIKPENIYMRRDGTPVLLDFGSARQALGQAKTMTILVAPGYAPLEQYYGDPVSQGPWTDIYGLGATCYRAITGHAPMDAVARAKGVLGSARELLQSAADAGRGRYSARFLLAIDHALQLNERDRPQSIAAWRRELLAPTEGVAPVAPVAPAAGPAPPAWHAPVGGIAAPLAAPAAAPGVSLPSAAPVAALTAPVAVAASAGLAAPVPAAGPPRQAEPRVAGPGAVAESVPLTPAPSPRSSWPLIAAGALLGVAGMTVVMFARSPGDTQGVPAPPLPASDAASKPRQADASPPAPVDPAPPPPASAASRPPGPAPQPTKGPPPPAPEKHRSKPLPPSPAPPVKGLPTQLPAQEPPGVLPKQEPKPAATPASAPASSPVSSPAASTPPPPPPQAAPPAAPPAVDVAAPRPDEKLKAAEVALQRGDTAAAIDRLKPLADAGVVHAQGLLGRAYERISGRMPSSLAYMWYSLAARHGEPGAAADRDRMAARLHDDEIAQANRQIEHFLKLHALPASGAPR